MSRYTYASQATSPPAVIAIKARRKAREQRAALLTLLRDGHLCQPIVIGVDMATGSDMTAFFQPADSPLWRVGGLPRKACI